jgi:hypothetical protein
MPTLWSNPLADPSNDPAVLQSRFEVHAAPIAGVLDSIMRQRMAEQQQIQQALGTAAKGVAGYMQKRQSDQIAQTLLDQASNYDNENPTPTEEIARNLNESPAHPSDAWTAYQHFADSMAKRDLEGAQTEWYRRRGQGEPQPMYDEAGNIIGYSTPSGVPHLTKPQPDAGLLGTGVTTKDLSQVDMFSPNVVKYKDAEGNPLSKDAEANPPEGSVATFDIRGPYGQTQTRTMPLSVYLSIRDKAASGPGAAAYGNKTTASLANSPQGTTDAYQAARDAIAKGADPAAVKKRLADAGYDPNQL